jgi:preprotein translocase subunit SecE
VAKAVKSNKSKTRKPTEAAKAARANGKQVKQIKEGRPGKAPVKVRQTKVPSRWARARSSANQAVAQRKASRAQGAKTKREPGGLRKFLRDVRVEMGKVTWPTRKDLVQSTVVVIVAVLIMSSCVMAFDYVFSRIVDQVLRLIGA